jgi:hypothetical protein
MRKKEQGVPWTCECCDDASPKFYVHYILTHGSFEGGHKRFTKLACSEHLTEVIASAARIQGRPAVIVEDIKGREEWKRRNFGKHYGTFDQETGMGKLVDWFKNNPKEIIRQRQMGTIAKGHDTENYREILIKSLIQPDKHHMCYSKECAEQIADLVCPKPLYSGALADLTTVSYGPDAPDYEEALKRLVDAGFVHQIHDSFVFEVPEK